MPRLKHKKKGKRVNIWLDHDSLQTAEEIDNLSNFFQMALRQASGIMALDIIQRAKNLPEMPKPTQEQLDQFNAAYPQNELTQKRKTQTWPSTPSSVSKPNSTL